MTGATVPWVPGSGVGRRPHRGRGPDALPANYLLLCVCITSSALVFAHWDSCTYAPGPLTEGTSAEGH